VPQFAAAGWGSRLIVNKELVREIMRELGLEGLPGAKER
jgi:hypothetical protein